ncbi:MAG: dihydropteroate synthase [Dehalococcoidia bacterium]|nr:dihydropteroate synthase [Dehalococcoidia bacterium]
MNLIGENIHIISRAISEAVKARDAGVIQELAKAQTASGADYLDLNMGPARQNPGEVAAWLVNTVQEVTDLPLSIDTMNPVAMEAALEVAKKRPIINSASGKAESKELMMPLAITYNAEIILSVITDAGCPPDVDSRVEAIMDTFSYATELGIKPDDIRIDPIILPISADQKQCREALEFVKILPDLLPGVKSVIGLSNVSNGTPGPLRGILNRTYLTMMERDGLYSAIADVLDPELMEMNRGGLQEIKHLICRVVDGEQVSLRGLSEKEQDYVKTARVLHGDALYSHAWLES